MTKTAKRTFNLKFDLGQDVEIKTEPGWTGTIVLISCADKRYLLDCHPGACAGYGWFIAPKGWGGHGDDNVAALNWFDEKDLREIK